MSAGNGREIIKVGRKGRKWFQMGEPPNYPEPLQHSEEMRKQADEFVKSLRAMPPDKRRQELCKLGDAEPAEYLRAVIASDPVEVDVIKTHNIRCRIDDKYVKPGTTIIDPEHTAEWEQEINTFVTGIFQGADLSGAEIQEFLFQVSEEAAKLKPFFSKASEEKPSSPGTTELIFSQ